MLESRDTEDGSCMFLIMGRISGEYHEWVATCREARFLQGSKAIIVTLILAAGSIYKYQGVFHWP
jgi:hypothetical protein